MPCAYQGPRNNNHKGEVNFVHCNAACQLLSSELIYIPTFPPPLWVMHTAQEIIAELTRRETRLARIQERAKEGDSIQRMRDAMKGVQKRRGCELASHSQHLIIIALVTHETVPSSP